MGPAPEPPGAAPRTMSAPDFPVSSLLAGARSTIGGVLAFFAGLVGGTLIVLAAEAGGLQFFKPACLVGWMVLIPFAVARLWGLLLLPFLGVMLYGLVWRDWNRLVGAALVAIALSAATLLSARKNPFETPESGLAFGLALGAAVLLLFSGIAWERARQRPARRPAKTP